MQLNKVTAAPVVQIAMAICLGFAVEVVADVNEYKGYLNFVFVLSSIVVIATLFNKELPKRIIMFFLLLMITFFSTGVTALALGNFD